jgi:hypothetical protein
VSPGLADGGAEAPGVGDGFGRPMHVVGPYFLGAPSSGGIVARLTGRVPAGG